MFVCPGCSARYRVTKAPKSGRIKCPRCGQVSQIPPDAIQQDTSAAPTPPPMAVPEIALGCEISGHKILEFIRGTADAGVYKASQISMGRPVSFHALKNSFAADAAAKSKFFSDARAMARLNHPNLIAVFDMSEESGTCFYTTEFLDASPLPEYLAAQPKLSSSQRLTMATQVARGLAYAEAVGVTDFWLRPADVLVPVRGDLRLAGIGVSRPPAGGPPSKVLDVLARLLVLIAGGTDNPAGQPSASTLPPAKDALGSQLNTLVAEFVDQKAYTKAADVLAKLEELLATMHRQKTISSVAAPGGISSPHIERAKQQSSSILPIIIAAGAGIAIFGGLLLWVLMSRQNAAEERRFKEAQGQITTQPDKAIETFRDLKKRHAGKKLGEAAKANLLVVEKKVIGDEYAKILTRLGKKIIAPKEHAVEVEKVKAKLLADFTGSGPYGDPDLDEEIIKFINDQATTCQANLHARYDDTARNEWDTSHKPWIANVGYKNLNYGDVIKRVREFQALYPESRAAKDVEAQIDDAKKTAKEHFDRVMKEADDFIAKPGEEYKRSQISDALEVIISHYGQNDGMGEYVAKATEKKNQLQGSH